MKSFRHHQLHEIGEAIGHPGHIGIDAIARASPGYQTASLLILAIPDLIDHPSLARPSGS
jgi:hypothetical protein